MIQIVRKPYKILKALLLSLSVNKSQKFFLKEKHNITLSNVEPETKFSLRYISSRNDKNLTFLFIIKDQTFVVNGREDNYC